MTSPSEPICPGNPVIFTCQQHGRSARWTINLQPALHRTVLNTQVGSVITFGDDRGFHFELHIVSSNDSNVLTSKLQVTVVRELNRVTVQCAGTSGTFMSTIHVASIGEYSIAMGFQVLARAANCSSF